MTTSPRNRIVFLTPVFAVLALLAVELVSIRQSNGGRFVYTLDDPYIHLAVAEEIGQGNYGVNPDETSSPSSSLLWPFVLVLFGAAEWSPLLLNAIFAVGIAILYARIVIAAIPGETSETLVAFRAAFAVLLVGSTNVIGLTLNGMEHCAHLLLTLLLVLGFWTEARTGRLPAWLPAVLVAGPLFRYEALAFSVPGIALLAVRGHWRAAVVSALLVVGTLGAFSLYLVSLGLGPIPTSVLLKNDPVSVGSFASLAFNAHVNLDVRQGGMLAIVGLAVAAALFDARRSSSERLFAAWIASGIAIHFLVGRFGWFHRYEIYSFAAALSAALLLHGSTIASLATRRPWLTFAGASALLLVLAYPYWDGLRRMANASSNIYEQHYQMHRFVTEYWKEPIAVNDLGFVAYQNDGYVLDLWGLASARALEARQRRTGPAWMEQLTNESGARLAMIYEAWFKQIPESWVPIADLRFEKKIVSAARARVTFFALTEGAREKALPLFDAIRPTLPKGVTLEVRDGAELPADASAEEPSLDEAVTR